MKPMTTRLSSVLLCALALSLASAPLLSRAQTPAVAPTDTNAGAAKAPEPAAAPAAAPAAETPAPTERPTTYTVQPGDAVATIAHKFGITWTQLRKANNLKKGALLHPGQVLQIPPAPAAATK